MPFIPKSHQQNKRKQRPEKSPEEVRTTIAQIREMCDKVELELGGDGAQQTFDMREAKPVPTSLGLCPDEFRQIIDENMAYEAPPMEVEPPAPIENATPSVYDDVFDQ